MKYQSRRARDRKPSSPPLLTEERAQETASTCENTFIERSAGARTFVLWGVLCPESLGASYLLHVRLKPRIVLFLIALLSLLCGLVFILRFDEIDRWDIH
jgi:hypothetical protein